MLKNKRVMVTGGAGFLGTYVVERLQQHKCSAVVVPKIEEYNLVQLNDIEKAYEDARPDIVIHLAALVGGIQANSKNPGKYFFDNLMMGVQMMEVARRYNIEKFVALGTICCYPKYTSVPFREEDVWNGYPEETNAPYGLAKKMLIVQSKSYREQYGFNSICLLPVNLYGPGDNFNPETSHVIPALIKKCYDALDNNKHAITVWGSGTVSREFFYVEDAADAIVLAAEHYNKSEPVNLGTGREITIRDLVDLIAELTGFSGEIRWDSSKPDGQPRRCLEVSKAFKEFGFRAKTDLRDGLVKTIHWYRKNRINEKKEVY